MLHKLILIFLSGHLDQALWLCIDRPQAMLNPSPVEFICAVLNSMTFLANKMALLSRLMLPLIY